MMPQKTTGQGVTTTPCPGSGEGGTLLGTILKYQHSKRLRCNSFSG